MLIDRRIWKNNWVENLSIERAARIILSGMVFLMKPHIQCEDQDLHTVTLSICELIELNSPKQSFLRFLLHQFSAKTTHYLWCKISDSCLETLAPWTLHYGKLTSSPESECNRNKYLFAWSFMLCFHLGDKYSALDTKQE